jgi:hypothetical protein
MATTTSLSTLNTTKLSALQGSFYHGAFPLRTLEDYEKRGYEALLQRDGETWHVPLGRIKHTACLYQKRDYMVGFFGGPDSLRCFPGGLKKQVRFFSLALVGCCSERHLPGQGRSPYCLVLPTEIVDPL